MSSIRKPIFLLGFAKHQITGSKLPSIGDSLKALFYNLRVAKFNLNESASLVIDECLIFWKKARIPTQESHKCREKLKKIYENWRNLLKSKKRTTVGQKQKEQKFCKSLNNLFDISHKNALILIKNEQDRQFLINQQKEGRIGSMLGVDKTLAMTEKRKLVRLRKEQERRKRYLEAASTSTGKINKSNNCLLYS